MAGRPHLNTSNLNMHNNVEEEVLFNPAEHKDLAHFFTQVDQTETFALTANEWLGIRSGGQQFNPVGSVGPLPSRPNSALTSATRSLMAINTPVSSISPSSNLQNTNGQDVLAQQSNSVRAWRPHEVPFDPSVHSYSSNEHEIRRRASSSSSNYHMGNTRDRSSDAAGHRKRPAPTAYVESLPSNKRPRSVSNSHSHPHSYSDPSTIQLPNGSGPSSASGSSATNQQQQQQQQQQQHKPPLLTAQQKKANHILSEQKRRAKIRRGYEALCDVVPNLRSAILAEQEAMDSKKKRGKAKGTVAAASAAGDGLDGRAGPKSESVVLTETIDHMELLAARKDELLARLAKAQSHFPPGQNVINAEASAIWEKEWDGGTGIEDGEEDDEDDDEDEDTA
ncbi:hypothetical protein M408DRAFT_326012 [Serendipita vermifera MAFF 305830]|uniref:BHLH domain-containing protein n=1 Tax=Serendipita vermifera MAFF 305830 TaxID=933852 RepID=A0A0C3BP63_SERVB|nr:hypothetical protein M408DRAFT_326012 [Serendipita vermifera MAFF 305830]